MSWLENIQEGPVKEPRKILLYGTQGWGKSTFASLAEKPVFIKTEAGLADINCKSIPREGKLESYDDFIAVLRDLFEGQHDFKTCVIDTADWLEKLIHFDLCKKKSVETIADIGYGKGPGFALPFWSETLACLDALRMSRDMTIILLAHDKVERFNDPMAEPYDRYVPALDKLAAAVLQEWCTEVYFATYKTYVKSTDAGFNKTRNQGIGNGERILKTEHRPSHQAKNRLGLPYEIECQADNLPAIVANLCNPSAATAA